MDEDVTIGLTSIEREYCVMKVLESIKKSPFTGEVILADQNKEIHEFYDNYDIEILDLDYDVGIGYAKNRVIEQVNTDYLLWLDDDVLFDYFAYKRLYQVIKEKEDFGWISCYLYDEGLGEYFTHCANIAVEDDVIVREIILSSNEFIEVDQPSNVAIYDMEIFDHIKHDEDIKVRRQHLDFAYRFQDIDYKAGFAPYKSFTHLSCPDSKEYENLRSREQFEKAWKKKQGFSGVKRRIRH